MITFAGNLILTADEGEPRLGYGEGCVDPKGSVTVIDISSGIDNQRDMKIPSKLVQKCSV